MHGRRRSQSHDSRFRWRNQAVAMSTREPSSRWSHYDSYAQTFARIKVIGVGGAGGNAINRMVRSGVDGIEFVAVNTDAQALLTSKATIAVRIGDKLTKGLGAGGRPEIGERAAEESAESLAEMVRDCDMVFITAGMGGGTGTGASPVIARLAKAAGALTVGVVTKPFEFEGGRRRRAAEEGIAAPARNRRRTDHHPERAVAPHGRSQDPITEAFRIADDVLRQGIAGISDLITKPGVINLDFADVKTIMHDAGSALMAIGYGEGETRCIDAAREAIESPLLEMSIQGATGVLYNITGGTESDTDRNERGGRNHSRRRRRGRRDHLRHVDRRVAGRRRDDHPDRTGFDERVGAEPIRSSRRSPGSRSAARDHRQTPAPSAGTAPAPQRTAGLPRR